MGWLKKLSLKVPETTDDLEKVILYLMHFPM